MKNYLDHLTEIGDDNLSFARKIAYYRYNLGKYIPRHKKSVSILEVGPGNGSMIKYLNDHGLSDIDIVDNDLTVVDFVTKRFTLNKKFVTSDISQIKRQLRKYDLIIMLQVFEHLPKNQYAKVVKTLYSSLKVGGKIIIMVPNGGNPLNLLERYSDLQHENIFTEHSLGELPGYCEIKNSVVKIEPYRIPPVSLINIIRIIMQRILHFIVRTMMIVNGGVYQKIMTPNITLVITKHK